MYLQVSNLYKIKYITAYKNKFINCLLICRMLSRMKILGQKVKYFPLYKGS